MKATGHVQLYAGLMSNNNTQCPAFSPTAKNDIIYM